jgi:nitronate monooxygenase
MTTPLHRPVCELLGCTYPIVLAGMGGVARSELAAAVTEAGGFGFLGMVRESAGLIRSEVEAMRKRGIDRFGVNLIPAATPPALLEAEVAACLEFAVPVVALFWDLSEPVIKQLRAAGTTVVCQVGSVDEAHAAEAAGAQVLIVQGVEAGGHVRGDRPLHEILPEIAGVSPLPLLAAGGIANGADVATVMSLGAQGAVLGTALIATPESFAHDYHRKRLVEASAKDTVLTDVFHVNWPKGAKVRVLKNSVTRGERGDPFAGVPTVIGDEKGRRIFLFSTDSPSRDMTGDFEAMALYAGTSVERISAVVGAAERVRAIVAEATALLDANAQTADAAAELASPACSAREMDDRYMGFAGRDEMLAALNELLEAERAGARVTLVTAKEAAEGLKPLVMAIHRDEARWCGALIRAIQEVGGKPSQKTGAFYDKAMAIADLSQRLTFLNRGQGWVVRKLEALLPTVRDDRIHADLTAMFESHKQNIERVNTQMSAQ